MIGLFNECFPPVMDGVSLTVSNLARCFYQQGRDVAVVTPEMPGLDESQLPYSVFLYRSFPIPGRHPYRYALARHLLLPIPGNRHLGFAEMDC